MVAINKVSPGRLGRREIRTPEPELPDSPKPSPLLICVPPLQDVDICCCIHYLCETLGDKWILNPCYLYKAADEVHNSFDLVSRSAPTLLQTDALLFFFLFTTLNLRIYCRAKE